MEAGRPLPKAAFFPFVVGVTTDASRQHAIERWHLPHYMKDLQMEFTETDDELSLSISDEGQPVLDLSVTNFPGVPEVVLFNAFTVNEEDRFKVNIFMDGEHTEHEEESGSLTLHPHEMTEGLTLDDISSISVPGTVVPRRATDVRGARANLEGHPPRSARRGSKHRPEPTKSLVSSPFPRPRPLSPARGALARAQKGTTR